MKIRRVVLDNRRKRVAVHLRSRELSFPYALLDPAPSADDPVVSARVDPELGNEGFTYELRSGTSGSLHVDSVLEHNRDPAHLVELLLYRLTLAAEERLERSPLSMREIARRLGTSASQLYRLLDPANGTKSIGQMVALLSVLGCDVELDVRDRSA